MILRKRRKKGRPAVSGISGPVLFYAPGDYLMFADISLLIFC
ncbi:hypothetical protein CLOBOL_00503 [Enterocloster bolteae ATCC BAA-613]|uniref:Uncharacterized protein n=1 Tax=Enterocloster bolteae (strain ATCC BAA-613 / DSM 15670 / CCUG 46953 / JCM 12243 / WAL 16351) TaxID=411902 RepID=A8RHT8_ENTBW|nr:hypothetical protein CLOBOL_00503 [Enterocloster bolteae ATCC BAA-613]